MSFSNSQSKKEETKEELELRKANLLTDISTLGQTKEALDAVIANHDAQSAQYSELGVSIDNKKNIIALLEPEIKKMTEVKNKLEKECEVLIATIEDKNFLKSEIDKFKKMIKILQSEHAEFESNFSQKRKKAESTLTATIEKLDFLHASVGSIRAQLK